MNETLTFHLNCQRFEFVIYLDLDARKPVFGVGGGGGDEDCEQQRRTLMCFQVISDPRFSFFLNSSKLNLEERHLACGFKCTPRNLNLFLGDALICT